MRVEEVESKLSAVREREEVAGIWKSAWPCDTTREAENGLESRLPVTEGRPVALLNGSHVVLQELGQFPVPSHNLGFLQNKSKGLGVSSHGVGRGWRADVDPGLTLTTMKR